MSEIKEHDEYLSDIHVENLPIEKKENRICVSQIEFILPVGREKRCKSELFDSDGDLVVNRPEKHKFMIEHNLETDLDNVGKILKWRLFTTLNIYATFYFTKDYNFGKLVYTFAIT